VDTEIHSQWKSRVFIECQGPPNMMTSWQGTHFWNLCMYFKTHFCEENGVKRLFFYTYFIQ